MIKLLKDRAFLTKRLTLPNLYDKLPFYKIIKNNMNRMENSRLNRRSFLRLALGAAGIAFLPASFQKAVRADISDFDFSDNEKASLVFRHLKLGSDSSTPVGVQLAMVTDTSYSMSDTEYAIQMEATATALNSQLFRNVLKYKGGERSVAICLIDFATDAYERIAWVDIRGDEIHDKPYQPDAVTGLVDPKKSSGNPDKLDLLANEILNLPRLHTGGTDIGEGLRLSEKMFKNCPWPVKEKRVVDLVGDGTSSKDSMDAMRYRLEKLGVTINGFAISNERKNLDVFFEEFLVTGGGTQSEDGIMSAKGRVWTLAKNMAKDIKNDQDFAAYFNDMALGMAQKLSVEVAGLDAYYAALARTGQKAWRAVPKPA